MASGKEASGEWRVEDHYSLLTTRYSQLATHYSLLATRCWRDEGQDTANALVGMQVDWLPVSARMACGSNCIGSRKQEPAETTARGAIRA